MEMCLHGLTKLRVGSRSCVTHSYCTVCATHGLAWTFVALAARSLARLLCRCGRIGALLTCQAHRRLPMRLYPHVFLLAPNTT